MKHNNSKNEMIEDVNKLMGLLISLRTVETSPLNSTHWVNDYIEKLSILRYHAVDDQDLCSECDGTGADYPAYAESISDAVACPACRGFGFNSNEGISVIINEIKNLSSKNNSLINYCTSLLEKKLYQI